jgi:hypothetical protein
MVRAQEDLQMRLIAATFVLPLTVAVAGCQSPTSPAMKGDAGSATRPLNSEGVQLRTTGGGHYTIPGDIELEFGFSALVLPNGRAEGNFHHQGIAEGELIQFSAEVTCLSIDAENHRAWIGGVITENRSTHPQFTTPIHQVGHDIWFRVQDNDAVAPSTTPDVTTIVGFESPTIPSSQFYCDTQPWRSNNVWPVVGNLSVGRNSD